MKKGGLRWPHRPFQVICVLVAVLLAAAFSLQAVYAAYAAHPGARPVPDKPNLGTLGERLNTNTIAIVSGNPNATYLTIAYDMSDVLDDGDNFRILPVIGKGGGQNIRDVRFLKGIDLGITQSIILNEYRESNEIGKIDDQIVYIAKLFNEEMHVVVRADSGITSLEQLDGKKVNFSDIGSGSQFSSRDIFRRLGVHPQEVNMSQGDALEKLKTGELAATILIAGKPAGAMGKLRSSDGFQFLTVPFSKPLQADYLPAVLGRGDYPGMVETGHDVNTIAASAVLIAYNWPRIPTATGASPVSSMRSFPRSPRCRSRRTIRNGARPIWPRRCRAGRGLPGPTNGSRKTARRNRRRRPRAISSISLSRTSARPVQIPGPIARPSASNCFSNFCNGRPTSTDDGDDLKIDL